MISLIIFQVISFLYPFKRNCHRGCRDWRPDLNTPQDYADIAAAVQRIYEEIFTESFSAYYMTDPRI